MKKYKRYLSDAERNVARMAEEIKQAKENTGDPASFVCPLDHGMSDEEAAEFRRAQEEAEEARNEAMFAKQEVDDLKRELWDVKVEKRQLEEAAAGGNGEDVDMLEGQIEELRGLNEDLDSEVKGLREEVEQKNDELVSGPRLHLTVLIGFRMCCKINWRKKNKKLEILNLVASDPSTTTN